MYKWFYAGNALVDLPLFALGFFLLFFAAVVVWATVLKRPRDFDAVAALPLDDSPRSTGAPR